MKPIVYIRETDVNALFASNKLGMTYEGYAYAMDNYDVIHAFTSDNDFIQKGKRIKCLIKIEPNNTEVDLTENLLFISFSIEDNIVVKNGVFQINKQRLDCDVRYIPDKNELYSRSKGLLEVSTLAAKKVAIVGLGSGGSTIAIELAKAGVGNFILMDYDRIELSNIARHVCNLEDLGRLKTLAIKESILKKNPYANVETFEIDVVEQAEITRSELSKVDLIICASDNDQSRFLLNEIALKNNIVALFGRAITRAAGGDVFRVRPYVGPCYNCLFSLNIRQEGGNDEEISSKKQADKLLPDYTSEDEKEAIIQVGLSNDILPISNLMIKLALVELAKNTNSGINSLEEDLIADYYIWANRREGTYSNWSKLEYNFDKPTILRWYGARVSRDSNCMVCGI